MDGQRRASGLLFLSQNLQCNDNKRNAWRQICVQTMQKGFAFIYNFLKKEQQKNKRKLEYLEVV